MAEIRPDHVPSPWTLLAWDGTAYRPVTIDAAGHLQIDVVTAAGLEDALQSVATDRLIVRGEDQLFSFRSTLRFVQSGNPSGANGYLDTIGPTTSEVWVVTNVAAMDSGSALTGVQFYDFAGAVEHCFYEDKRAIAVGEYAIWSGHLYLVNDDVLRVYFPGCGAGDTVYIAVTGYMMTPET